MKYERNNDVYSIDDFYDIWDNVSEDIISDEFWNSHQDFIRDITYELYRVELKNGKINIKVCAKRLEIMFSSLFKYGIIS